jgi:hypothetical protein
MRLGIAQEKQRVFQVMPETKKKSRQSVTEVFISSMLLNSQ